MLGTTHVVKVVRTVKRRLTEEQRKQHELLSLLEAPSLSASRLARLAVLLKVFAAEVGFDELARFLMANRPREDGCLRVPRSYRVRESHFNSTDSEDPAMFLSVKPPDDDDGTVPESELRLIQNASGLRVRLGSYLADHREN